MRSPQTRWRSFRKTKTRRARRVSSQLRPGVADVKQPNASRRRGRDAAAADPGQLFALAEALLRRAGSQGAERAWLIEQLVASGYPEQRVAAALAVLVAERRARRGTGDDGAPVVVEARAA